MPLRAVLKTARLTLRQFDADDEAAVVSGIGDWEVARWLTAVPHPYGPDEFRDFLRGVNPGEVWAVCDGKGCIGAIGLNDTFGYWLARSAWGKGYATEAARAVLAAHFAEAASGAVRSGYYAGNGRSARVLAKFGFRPEGFRMAPVAALDGKTALLHRVALTRAGWIAASPLVIETDRLILKPLDPDRDWRGLARIGGDPQVAPMLQSIPTPWPEPDVRAWIVGSQWRGHPGFRLGIFLKEGPLVGSVGLSRSTSSMMYFLEPSQWGRGYATEAMRAFLGWSLDRFAPTEFEADHFADNPASGRVLEKLGFIRVGTDTGTSRARPGPAPNILWRYRVSGRQDSPQNDGSDSG